MDIQPGLLYLMADLEDLTTGSRFLQFIISLWWFVSNENWLVIKLGAGCEWSFSFQVAAAIHLGAYAKSPDWINSVLACSRFYRWLRLWL